MSDRDHRATPAGLTERLLSAMPACRLASPPEGFGWAPAKHLRASLVRQGRTEKVVIRQAWELDRFETEVFLYNSFLGRLRCRIPKLWGTFTTDESSLPWMVLEDIGERYADADKPEQHRAFLQALGWLHGQGLDLLASGELADSPVPHYTRTDLGYTQWEKQLRFALGTPAFGLSDWLGLFWAGLQRILLHQPQTLLHGDTDHSNAVLTGDGVALVDWERACIGPPGMDLGRAMERHHSMEDLAAYLEAFSETAGRESLKEEARVTLDSGLAHNAIRWICYYVKQVREDADPGPEWRASRYEPLLKLLAEIHSRHPDWSQ